MKTFYSEAKNYTYISNIFYHMYLFSSGILQNSHFFFQLHCFPKSITFLRVMIVCDTIMIFFFTTIFSSMYHCSCNSEASSLVVIAQTSEVKLKCHELHATSNKFTVGSKSFVKLLKHNPNQGINILNFFGKIMNFNLAYKIFCETHNFFSMKSHNFEKKKNMRFHENFCKRD